MTSFGKKKKRRQLREKIYDQIDELNFFPKVNKKLMLINKRANTLAKKKTAVLGITR